LCINTTNNTTIVHELYLFYNISINNVLVILIFIRKYDSVSYKNELKCTENKPNPKTFLNLNTLFAVCENVKVWQWFISAAPCRHIILSKWTYYWAKNDIDVIERVNYSIWKIPVEYLGKKNYSGENFHAENVTRGRFATLHVLVENENHDDKTTNTIL